MERLLLANPYNEKEKRRLQEFENQNNISIKLSEELHNISLKYSNEEYLKIQNQANELVLHLLLEHDGKIEDYCSISGEKDRKTAKILLASIPKRTKKKIIKLAIDYALNVLGMEDVFLLISPNDKNVLLYLKELELEDLGEENGSIVYLIENLEKKSSQRMIAWKFWIKLKKTL